MSRELILMSACMTTALVTAPATARAADARDSQARVAVVDAIDLPERMEETKAQLRDLMDAAVRQRGFDLIRPPGAPACADAPCLAEVAKGSGATDVLITRGGKSGSHGYHVDLALWSAATGAVVPAVADCSVCTGPQMAEAVGRAAGPLLDTIRTRQASVATPPAPPSVVAVTPNPAPVLGNPAAGSATLEPHPARRIAGWSVLGLGVASAAAGAIYWNLDGKGTDCVGSSCRSTYHTGTEAVAFAAAGAVGIGVGVWLLVDPFGKRGVALGVSPSGAVLAGRF
jgi:hypothetical protein